MTLARRSLSALAVALAAGPVLAGCDSPPSCEKAVAHAGAIRSLSQLDIDHARLRCKQEQWSGELRACIAGAKDEDGLERCAARHRPRAPGGYAGYMARSKQTEAELNLHALERGLKTYYYEHAELPPGEVGPTPRESCCDAPGKRCQPDASLWAQEIWQDLDFSIDTPHRFTYRYASASGQQATVEASADLDCDGVAITFTLRCRIADYTPVCELERPSRPD